MKGNRKKNHSCFPFAADCYFKGEDGTFKERIQVNTTGDYYLAIRNKTQKTVSILGFVYY